MLTWSHCYLDLSKFFFLSLSTKTLKVANLNYFNNQIPKNLQSKPPRPYFYRRIAHREAILGARIRRDDGPCGLRFDLLARGLGVDFLRGPRPHGLIGIAPGLRTKESASPTSRVVANRQRAQNPEQGGLRLRAIAGLGSKPRGQAPEPRVETGRRQSPQHGRRGRSKP